MLDTQESTEKDSKCRSPSTIDELTNRRKIQTVVMETINPSTSQNMVKISPQYLSTTGSRNTLSARKSAFAAIGCGVMAYAAGEMAL